ncbi:MAG: metallophosphoesterase [Verrucomicrobiaceae bacterium]|nr:metallophosphoesterase [Verrucomicrobiaceae bacterium]
MLSRFALLFILLLPRLAAAWGAGHDDVMRAVLERLPEEVLAKFTPEIVKEAIHEDSHYPDSFQPFLPGEVGEAAVAALQKAGLKVRYDLHHDYGRVASFAMLVAAFREDDAAHIAHWIASHSHVIADMAACNHDPIVHSATYGWGPWKVKLPHDADMSRVAPLLDLAGSAHDTAGGAEAFASAIDRLMLHDDGRDGLQQVHEIMLYGHEGARFCSPRGVKVLQGAAAWIDAQDLNGRELLWQTIGELGAWAVVRTLRDVEVAMRLAKTDTVIERTPATDTAAKAAIETLMRERRLDEDALFAPILRDLQPADKDVIGVVLEPTWDMNDAMLGFSSRVQSAATVRTLQKLNRPHATFDVRRLLEEGMPSPKQVALMVIVATSFNNYHWMKTDVLDSALSDYVTRGGRVLWIMGNGTLPRKTFASFTSALKRTEKTTLPVPGKRFVGSKLIAHLPGNPSWQILNTPETPAGWQRPLCAWRIEPQTSSDLEPLITLESEGAKYLVGACTADHKLALLPIYAVTPHLMQKDRPVASPAEPELDEPSAKVLMGVIGKMMPGSAPIERIWLTHSSNDVRRITINWETALPGPSKVEYGTTSALGKETVADAPVTLHHVEIALDPIAAVHHYRVRSGEEVSSVHSFKSYSDGELRAVIFADRGYARDRDLTLLLKEDPHLVLTCGDNVASLHEKGIEGTKAFSALIDSAPELFRSTPFMPILGNHDRELTPRGPKPPLHPVYDVEATAYREFFPLPDEGWKWRFDIPAFGLRFLALDASHVKDQGTTWQTNHPVTGDSPQHQWYAREVAKTDASFVITLNNEQNAMMRGYDKGAWLPLFRQSSAVITGFGYFGERAEVDGFPYFNTCLKGDGDLYKDPKSAFVTREDNYVLLTLTKDAPTMKIQFKNLRGEVLDTREIQGRLGP